MILHCKNAEMTIILSFLHFYIVKSYIFCYFFLKIFFFLIWQFFTSEKIKKVKNKILLFLKKFKNWGQRIRKPRNKKKIALHKFMFCLFDLMLYIPGNSYDHVQFYGTFIRH